MFGHLHLKKIKFTQFKWNTTAVIHAKYALHIPNIVQIEIIFDYKKWDGIDSLEDAVIRGIPPQHSEEKRPSLNKG